MAEYHAEVSWRSNVPVSGEFDDPYFSLEDGLAETRHTFLDGNHLPERFRPGFRIAELGFGTGLNAAAALHAWRKAGVGGPLHFTSFELSPLPPDDMRRALAHWPEIEAECHTVLAALDDREAVDDLVLDLIIGDARETLRMWRGAADAWFLDGFAPAKNPQLWEPALIAEVARHTAPSGTCATYTAAGAVRSALSEAGFDVERIKGFGRKRHMVRGSLRQS